MTETIALSLDGITDLPAGKIANVVTFLERSGPATERHPPRPDLTVRRVQKPTAAWYTTLYRRIGEDWLWMSRVVMSAAELTALLAAPTTLIIVLERDGAEIGMAELDLSAPATVEIVTFGVVPEATGTGAATFLMGEVLAACAREGAKRVWLHTCTFDHPGAIRFYRARGFAPFKIAIEVSDDPRATGVLPTSAAPHAPYLGPAVAPRSGRRDT